MGYWKSKVLPRIKKIFEKDSTKKAAAVETCKAFDDYKEAIIVEFEEKEAELQSKVIEVFEASSNEIKIIVKEPKDAGIKKNSKAVHKFLEELVKIDFPGSKQAHEACSKFGPKMVLGPVMFVLEMVSGMIITVEEKKVRATTEEASKEKKEEEAVVEKEGREKKEMEEEMEPQKSEIIMEQAVSEEEVESKP